MITCGFAAAAAILGTLMACRLNVVQVLKQLIVLPLHLLGRLSTLTFLLHGDYL
jgi:hypothetical protein